MIYVFLYLFVGFCWVFSDILLEWERDRHGWFLPLVVLLVCSLGWPLYLAWKFHYLERGE